MVRGVCDSTSKKSHSDCHKSLWTFMYGGGGVEVRDGGTRSEKSPYGGPEVQPFLLPPPVFSL